MDPNARGFTLLETVVAIAVAVVLGWLAVTLAAHVLRVGRLQAARDSAQASVLQLTDDLATEEDDAWAIYVPPLDVLGASNSDGHEVDFFARDAQRQPYFWAYNYDANARTLTRYRFAAPVGSVPVADVTFSGVTEFAAHTYPVTALQDSSSPIYSALYAGTALQSGIVHFYPSMPWIAGGNNITYVQVAASGYQRSLQLVTQTAPSGFTIVLNYTPSPSPSASPGLSVWPVAVRFPVSGQALAYNCTTAEAFKDTGFTTPDTSGDPYDPSNATDSHGCMAKAEISLNEPGYDGTFDDWQSESNPCSSTQVYQSAWNPTSRNGPIASQVTLGGNTDTANDSGYSCNLGYEDSTTVVHASTVAAQVIQPCWAIGGSCSYSVTYYDTGGGSCDPSTGQVTGGYDGKGHASVSPASAGTWSGSNGNYTFTRTATGTVTVDVYSEYQQGKATQQKSGGYRCSYSYSSSLTESFRIQSV